MTKHVYFVITLCLLIPDVVFSEMEAKIVGGTAISAIRYPYAIKLYNGDSMCGGSIISSQAVLTAAHCFSFNRDVENMMIQTGEAADAALTALEDYNPEGIYFVWDIHTNSKYDNKLYSNDIGIVFASTPFKLGINVKKALLVNSESWKNPSAKFVAIGWGWTSYGGPVSPELMMTHLQFVPLETCASKHNATMTKDMFCLYGDGRTDTCKGDSGSGVSWDGLLVGIVSHGDGCAKKDKPSVYTNVFYFRKWIEKSLKKFNRDYCKYVFSEGSYSVDHNALCI